MRRARHPAQKRERRGDILAVAERLLEQTQYAEITMSQVAEKAGLAKGTLYLYFETKESLFFALAREQFQGWFASLKTGLELLPRRGAFDPVAQLIADSTTARPAFRTLITLLHGILEQNVAAGEVLSFKRELVSAGSAVGALLESRLPFLSSRQGFHFLLQLYSVAIGFQLMADPPPRVRELLKRPELAPFRLDFSAELKHATRCLLQGLRIEKEPSDAEKRRTAGTLGARHRSIQRPGR